jgi:hypothetical protein
MNGALSVILLGALDELAVLEGLSTQQIAARCVLMGRVPVAPMFHPTVVTAYQKLEADQVRGTPAWAVVDALEGRR